MLYGWEYLRSNNGVANGVRLTQGEATLLHGFMLRCELAFVVLVRFAASICANEYQVEEIPRTSKTSLVVKALNNRGIVVGQAVRNGDIEEAIVWMKGTGLVYLRSPEGIYSSANDINDANTIVGYCYSKDRSWNACIWKEFNTEPRVLPLAETRSDCIAISEGGDIAGTFVSASGDVCAFFLEKGAGIRKIEHDQRDTVVPYGLNSRGEVVGSAVTKRRGLTFLDPFVWSVTQGYLSLVSGEMDSGEALGVNDSGIVVGCLNSRACIWKNRESPKFLATLGGTASEARAINETGIVVGWSETKGGDLIKNLTGIEGITPIFLIRPIYKHACEWIDERVYDHNDFLPPNSEWVLKEAVDINNQGQIIGHGTIKEREAAFILTPRPSPRSNAD